MYEQISIRNRRISVENINQWRLTHDRIEHRKINGVFFHLCLILFNDPCAHANTLTFTSHTNIELNLFCAGTKIGTHFMENFHLYLNEMKFLVAQAGRMKKKTAAQNRILAKKKMGKICFPPCSTYIEFSVFIFNIFKSNQFVYIYRRNRWKWR